MEIWLDTINLESVEKAAKMGILHGITTNPSILARSQYRPSDTLQMLLEMHDGPIACQVIADDAKKMIEQAELFYTISERIVPKIPVTRAGLEALSYLSRENLKTMATAVFHPRQALLAALVGADYIAFYYSRIQDSGADALNIAKQMVELLKDSPSKLLASSLKNFAQLEEMIALKLDAITLKPSLFDEFTSDHPLTVESIEAFQKDWKAIALPKKEEEC